MLSAGLLIGSGGGAIATADTDGSAPSANAPKAESSSQAANAASHPIASIAGNLQKTLQNTVGTLATPNQQSKLPSSPKTEINATQIESGKKVTIPAAADSSAVAPDPNAAAPESNAVTPDPNTVAPVSDPTTPTTNPAPPATNPAPPATVAAVPVANPLPPGTNPTPPGTNPPPPVTNPPPSVSNTFSATNPWVLAWEKAVPPVTNAVLTLAYMVGSVPAAIAALPASATPFADAITMVQQILTQAASTVVLLAQLPSDLYSLMLGVASTPPTVVGVGAAANGGLAATNTAVSALAAVASSQVRPASGFRGWPLFGNVAPPPVFGVIAKASLSPELSLSGMAPLAPKAVSPADTRSFLEHAISAIVVPASLSALAAMALPGIGGLLVLCGAGIRVGYRQAKAAFAVRTAGIARFAGPGPLGIVRSGSLVALHLPRPRVVRPQVSRAAYRLDQAA